jgi:uncharacterized protein Veg
MEVISGKKMVLTGAKPRQVHQRRATRCTANAYRLIQTISSLFVIKIEDTENDGEYFIEREEPNKKPVCSLVLRIEPHSL